MQESLLGQAKERLGMRPDWGDFIVICLAAVAIIIMFLLESQHHANRIDDLEERVTTFETVRIEYVAPPQGVSP